MPIRARVGRHAKTGGQHCQNWSQDQQAIVGLLNRIPIDRSGAGGRLKPRIVDGIASDDLFNAILRFEEAHFPGQRSGYVDPGGLMYQRLESAAAAAPPVSSSTVAAAPPPSSTSAQQPSEVLKLLERARERLRNGAVNYVPVVQFLERLVREGKTRVLGPGVAAYVFGFAEIRRAGSSDWEPEVHHAGTPVYTYWRAGTRSGRTAIIMFNDSFIDLREDTQVAFLRDAPPQQGVMMRTQAEREKLRRDLSKLDRPR